MTKEQEYGQMLGRIGVSVEDYCITPETTVLDAVELLLLEVNELKAVNNRLIKENALLKENKTDVET